MSEQHFHNARIVLPDRVIAGWLSVEGSTITDIGEGPGDRQGHDVEGDLIMPGLIELHTDHLEQHLTPRPKVRWPTLSALIAFDAQIAASGITTVFDCIRVGNDQDYAKVDGDVTTTISAIQAAGRNNLLRADHHIHLRCEICADDVISEFETVISEQRVDLISLMDHTPGARQFTSLDAWRTYYGGKSGMSEDQLDRLIDLKHELFGRNYLRNRKTLVELARASGIVIASHDDATPDHVDESVRDQVALAEFPTTVEAARLSHGADIKVMMGAPNVVRGGSHSGNVAAETLAREGYLDVLSSDYVPASLLLAAFQLPERVPSYDLPRAMRTVTSNPAEAAGLTDRGAIAIGKRADLLRVSVHNGTPIVREVYRAGRRVV